MTPNECVTLCVGCGRVADRRYSYQNPEGYWHSICFQTEMEVRDANQADTEALHCPGTASAG